MPRYFFSSVVLGCSNFSYHFILFAGSDLREGGGDATDVAVISDLLSQPR